MNHPGVANTSILPGHGKVNSSIRFQAYLKASLIFFLLMACLSITAISQKTLSAKELKRLSVEELMDIEVTLVSRTPEKLTEAASAVQVITGEDIRRSAATNVPEALRLASNLQVAQLSSSVWLISARGFNSIFSNKLLVMIDGRTVYTPLYGGVLWEQQQVLLEDVERIEVVSGPGGTLWGANAVNGVINIVTKSSRQTKGLYASITGGDFVKDQASLRYGSQLGKQVSYRVYGQHFNREATKLQNGSRNTDAWELTQGGFRMDWEDASQNAFVVQGDYYGGKRKTAPGYSSLNGQNLLARWSHTFSEKSDLMLQVYYDRYFREDAPTSSSDKMKTIDADFQHRFPIGKYQSIVWGLGYRFVKDDANYTIAAGAGILPREKRLDLFSSFIQDEIQLSTPLKLTVGTKWVHNVYTGFEWQPNARIAWTKGSSTLWGAVSRAVRTPSRFDVDYYLPVTPQPPTVPSVAGGPNFKSEKLLAYEAGYRIQPTANSALSFAGFYNVYRDVYSVEALPGTLTYQIQNGSKAESWGGEFSGTWQALKSWQLRAGYTYFNKDIRAEAGHNFTPDYLGNDARNQALLQSMVSFPFHLEWDVTARYLDGLKKTFATIAVPAYFTFDVRLAYTFRKLELAVVGQNLAEKEHREFGSLSFPRNYYAKLSLRL